MKKEYRRRTSKLLKTKICDRNLIKVIRTGVVSFERHSGHFLNWIREELKQMDQRTKKLMIMHKTLQQRDNINKFYEKKEEGGSPALGIALMQQFKDPRNIRK